MIHKSHFWINVTYEQRDKVEMSGKEATTAVRCNEKRHRGKKRREKFFGMGT